jgi:hypothetical protein
MAVQIQFRRGLAAEWESVNPVLAEGEAGYELDTNKLKFGDGSTPWNDLPYTAGAAGVTGPAGATGPAGPVGATGPAGAQGVAGNTGATGPQGLGGATGPVGPSGAQGLQGATGPQGPAGSGVTIEGTAAEWPPALNPDVGDMWLVPSPVPGGFPLGTASGDGLVWSGSDWVNVGPIRGPQGEVGPQGPTGPQGVAGDVGATGPQGLNGDIGATGPQGVAGDIGPTGPQGEAGPQGATGPQGVNATGVTVAATKELTVSNTMTLASADGAPINFGGGGTVIYNNSIIDGGAY